jgi:hypothetical protein
MASAVLRFSTSRNSYMTFITLVAMTFGCIAPLMAGCRAHPGSLAIMFIGDAISDSDVKKRAPDLVGEPALAADKMFGQRDETIEMPENRSLQIYLVERDLFNKNRYVVETDDGIIVALTKTQYDADGIEDLIESAALKDKVIGKSPDECRKETELNAPILIGKSANTGEDYLVYDVKNWTNLRNARFCVLRFQDGACTNIRLIGVSASTKKSEPKH